MFDISPFETLLCFNKIEPDNVFWTLFQTETKLCPLQQKRTVAQHNVLYQSDKIHTTMEQHHVRWFKCLTFNQEIADLSLIRTILDTSLFPRARTFNHNVQVQAGSKADIWLCLNAAKFVRYKPGTTHLHVFHKFLQFWLLNQIWLCIVMIVLVR